MLSVVLLFGLIYQVVKYETENRKKVSMLADRACIKVNYRRYSFVLTPGINFLLSFEKERSGSTSNAC